MKAYILRGCFLSFFPSSEDYSLSTKYLPVLYIFRSTILRNLPCGLPPETPQPLLSQVCLCYRDEDKSVFVYVYVLAPNWVCLGQKWSQLEMISYSQAVYLSQQGAGPEDCVWGIHLSLCTSETAVAHEGVCEHTSTSRGTPRPFNQVLAVNIWTSFLLPPLIRWWWCDFMLLTRRPSQSLSLLYRQIKC